MQQANRRNGIHWILSIQLDDLYFADDIALLSQSHQQMQEKLREVEQKAAETGLHISIQKTKVLKVPNKDTGQLDCEPATTRGRQLLHFPGK